MLTNGGYCVVLSWKKCKRLFNKVINIPENRRYERDALVSSIGNSDLVVLALINLLYLIFLSYLRGKGLWGRPISLCRG